MIQIGIVGHGYWGPNLLRNFWASPRCGVASLCDLDQERLHQAVARYPGLSTTTETQTLISSPNVDAIVIATPVSTHFRLAMQALQAGKHVLVEKPLAGTAEQCLALIEEADRRQLVLLVDHTFAYTGAVRKLREYIDDGTLGTVHYYDSVRVNLGLFQHDVSVIWDLAVHDLSIMDFLFDEAPLAISACGACHVRGQPENVAYVTCFFQSNTIAHIAVNWLAPVKIRRTLLGGSKSMVVYDDLEPTEKVKLYAKGITLEHDPSAIHRLQVGYRTGDMIAPRLDSCEALATLAEHFLDCIEGSRQPITGGHCGLRVVQTMTAASESMQLQGIPVEIKY